MNLAAKRLLEDRGPVGVIGAGTMGAGIAQVAAAAGHRVKFFDVRPDAVANAVKALEDGLRRRIESGKLSESVARDILGRVEPVSSLTEFGDSALVVEVIVEQLEIKRALFSELEAIVGPQTILASNTSSISITALGRDLKNAERLVGMHFFNPVPAMRLVEVVSGTATTLEVAETIARLAKLWGKSPIHTRSTPGFVVNRIARPFYAECLSLLQDRYAEPDVIDAALRGVGFKMGPCELMDLIGHDVNYAVTESMYRANYFDKRFVPSLVQGELVDGGRLGKKSGRGFYDYRNEARPIKPPEMDAKFLGKLTPVRTHGVGATIRAIASTLRLRGFEVDGPVGPDSSLLSSLQGNNPADVISIGGALVFITDGQPAALIASRLRFPHVAVIDWMLAGDTGTFCVAFAPECGAVERQAVLDLVHALGRNPSEIGDAPGLIVARTIAMLINEAADAVKQEVCDIESANVAMKLGTNYPLGPFEWLQHFGLQSVCSLLNNLDTFYRGERYRTSLLLLSRLWAMELEVSNG